MQRRTQVWITVVTLLILLSLCSQPILQAQDISIPFDTDIVEIIERIPAPRIQQTPPVNNCGYEPFIRQSSWILMYDEAGETILCNADNGEIRQLPITKNWITYREPVGIYLQPRLSPDSEWLVLTAFGDEQYDYYAVSVSTDEVISLGSIPYSDLASYPPDPVVWLSSTQGAVIYRTNSDSIWDTLYGFNLSVPNSMNEVMRGYPHVINNSPPRVESLYSGRWLSRKAGTVVATMLCEFAIYDAEGFREYSLESDCQVEAGSSDPYNTYDVVRSDGEAISVLRIIDFDAGLSELIWMPIAAREAEPLLLYRGEIDYMLENDGGTTLSVLGRDGHIPSAIYEEYLFVDLHQFIGSDLLVATQRGAHVIPAQEIPNDLNIVILATSPDKSRVLLSNGAIYDVVEDRLVANITGGASINSTTVTWYENRQIVFTEEFSPETDEQITIRLRG